MACKQWRSTIVCLYSWVWPSWHRFFLISTKHYLWLHITFVASPTCVNYPDEWFHLATYLVSCPDYFPSVCRKIVWARDCYIPTYLWCGSSWPRLQANTLVFRTLKYSEHILGGRPGYKDDSNLELSNKKSHSTVSVMWAALDAPLQPCYSWTKQKGTKSTPKTALKFV